MPAVPVALPAALPTAVPVAVTTAPRPQVGALFPGGVAGSHSCTGTVVASPTGDLVITAAHCLSGSPRGWSFVPGYDAGRAPHGVWRVAYGYVDPRWRTGHDPHYDVAVLRIEPLVVSGRARTIQSVVGAYTAAEQRPVGTSTRLTAYNAGRGDRPVTCANSVASERGWPLVTCGGFYNGVSGSAFTSVVDGRTVIAGIIGGLHEGGCTSWQNYSSPFHLSWVSTLLTRASRRWPADAPTPSAGDGC